MILLEQTEVMGFEQAIRGMRNPMNSWDKSDSYFLFDYNSMENTDSRWIQEEIGPNDYDLMMKLVKGGSVHAKFRRMIAVYMDITAPLYWWKEFDTYKVGTVANSCSTMHKIQEKKFTLDDFSHEHIIRDWIGDHNDAIYYKDPPENGPIKVPMMFSPYDVLRLTIAVLNTNREAYLRISEQLKNDMEPNEVYRLQKLQKEYWWQMIQLLPSSYNQKRTVMLNYEVLAGIYQHRKNHKLDEWHDFCHWVEGLPYSCLITREENQHGIKEV
ncbi:MAG: hypothetical protein WCS17_14135 [Prevotella sp.]